MTNPHFRLSNGVTCVIEERPKSGKVSMQIHINSAVDENVDENGLTNLTSKASLSGTTTMSYEKLTAEIESRGGRIDAQSSPKLTAFTASSLARDAEDIFSIMADVIRHPILGDRDIYQAKMRIKNKLEYLGKDPAASTDAKFFEAAFSGQTAGLNAMGTPERLDSFTRAQVMAKHAEMLAHPENIVISFTGDINAAQAKKLVEDYFGDLPAATSAVAKLQEKFIGGDSRESNDNEQLNLEFGFEAPPFSDQDRYTAVLLKEVLSGFSGPLTQEIREKRSLVYTVQPRYIPLETSGVFSIMTGAGKGKAGELISVAINDVFGKIIRDGVDQKTLDEARERIIRSLKAQGETADISCLSNANQMYSYGRLRTLEESAAYYNQVTSDDIRRVCANMLRDGKYALAAVGPQETMPSEQAIKGMMQAQLKGVDVPLAKPVKPSIKVQFNQAAKKAEPVGVAPKMTVLKNGMKVVTIERPGTLSCGAWVGAGSDSETPVQNGAAHVLEHMMFKGTRTYDQPGIISKVIEGELGGGLNAYTTKDKTAYYFYNLEPEALAKTIDICGEMVFDATLEPTEFDGKAVTNPDGSKTMEKVGEREVIIEELNRRNDNAQVPLGDLMFEAAYPNQPHGLSTIGTEKTLRALTVEDFTAFRDENYVPNNVVFSAAGPIKHEDFVALIEKKYGQMPAKAIVPASAPVYKGGASYIVEPSATLCNVLVATPSAPDTDPDNFAYKALGMILGGSDSARLFRGVIPPGSGIRNVGASEVSFGNAGLFFISGSMPAQNIAPFINTVGREIYKLSLDLTEAELNKVKASMEMSLLAGMETNSAACNLYASNVLSSGKLITQTELSAQIQKLTVDDIKRVAQKVLASPPTQVMAVPPGTDPRYLPQQRQDSPPPPAQNQNLIVPFPNGRGAIDALRARALDARKKKGFSK